MINDREEVIVTRAGYESVVFVSLDDCNCLWETTYLLRSPENARRLLDAMENLEAGGGDGNEGIGKLEPLQQDLSAYWIRRIADEHRLVYKVAVSEVHIAACRYHY